MASTAGKDAGVGYFSPVDFPLGNFTPSPGYQYVEKLANCIIPIHNPDYT